MAHPITEAASNVHMEVVLYANQNLYRMRQSSTAHIITFNFLKKRGTTVSLRMMFTLLHNVYCKKNIGRFG